MKETGNEIKGLFDRGEGEWDHAVERHFEYLRFYPNSAVTYYNLGLNFAQKGQDKNAEIAFKKALSLKPEMPEALINLGGLAYGRKDFDACIEYNEKALKLESGLALANCNIAFAHSLKGNDERAVELFSRIVDEHDEYAAAHYGLAVSYDALGKADLSRKHYERAISLGYEPSPDFAEKMKS